MLVPVSEPGDGVRRVLPHPRLLHGAQRRFLAGVVLGVAGHEDVGVFAGGAGHDRGLQAQVADLVGKLLHLRLRLLPAARRLGPDADGVDDAGVGCRKPRAAARP